MCSKAMIVLPLMAVVEADGAEEDHRSSLRLLIASAILKIPKASTAISIMTRMRRAVFISLPLAGRLILHAAYKRSSQCVGTGA